VAAPLSRPTRILLVQHEE